MKIDAILKADVLDIIFENRNKMYGAYTLRKFYNNRLYKALGLMLLLVGILSSFTFLNSHKAALDKPIIDSGFTVIQVLNKPETVKPAEIVVPKKPTVPKQPIASKAFVNHFVIVKDGKDTKIDNLDPNDMIADITQKGDPAVLAKVNQDFQAPKDSGAYIEPQKPTIDKNSPTPFAEVMPKFPGGMDALRDFLRKNLQAPEDLEAGEMVSVKIRFVVGYDGMLKAFETVEDGGKAFNNEVIRVLKKMPNWIPGKTKGENVSVFYTIPVKFTPIE